mmetsp:Transcript_26797/g.58768  ORF Transcript_26797/g.58768 Transcript_26797/m.58768 type:complete len:209 (-) Transcript_26797:1517-2143(-)
MRVHGPIQNFHCRHHTRRRVDVRVLEHGVFGYFPGRKRLWCFDPEKSLQASPSQPGTATPARGGSKEPTPEAHLRHPRSVCSASAAIQYKQKHNRWPHCESTGCEHARWVGGLRVSWNSVRGNECYGGHERRHERRRQRCRERVVGITTLGVVSPLCGPERLRKRLGSGKEIDPSRCSTGLVPDARQFRHPERSMPRNGGGVPGTNTR